MTNTRRLKQNVHNKKRTTKRKNADHPILNNNKIES